MSPGEGLLDETTQGKIGNLLDEEVGQFHCLWDLKVWPVNESLVALFNHIWINRTLPDHGG
jgi:hypothetical protein